MPHENSVSSHIHGQFQKTDFWAAYHIVTTSQWSVISFEIEYSVAGQLTKISIRHAEDGWYVNGNLRSEFKNCIDMDITLTPFTNTLPINRLDLQFNNPRQIEVFYVNVLENKIYPVRQQYIRKSAIEYNFQNVPNDFEADIIVDNEGFVVHYPHLFERIET
jgi:hypothetical protein